MTEYDKCQNLARLTQRPRGCQNSKMVLKDSSTTMIRTQKKRPCCNSDDKGQDRAAMKIS